MADEFKEGDTVQLKSGGPTMTVSNVVERYGISMVWCAWFDGKKKVEDEFKPGMLKKVNPE